MFGEVIPETNFLRFFTPGPVPVRAIGNNGPGTVVGPTTMLSVGPGDSGDW